MQTAFNVRCRAHSATYRSVAPEAGVEGQVEHPRHTELRKILVVDDEPELAHLAQLLLCAYGLEVVVAYSAAEALRILASDPDINGMFSDVMMPGESGLALARTVGRLHPQVRIVLASGYISPALMSRHGKDGPYLFAAKPYRIETVIALFRSHYSPAVGAG